MDWQIYVLVGLPWAVVLWDRFQGRRDARHQEEQDSRIARCACTHVFSAHDLEEPHACGADLKREHYLKGGARNGWEWVPCPCKRYDGPIPIETVFQPPKPLHLPPSGSTSG